MPLGERVPGGAPLRVTRPRASELTCITLGPLIIGTWVSFGYPTEGTINRPPRALRAR